MPYFIFRGYDTDSGAAAIRGRVRAAHRAYIRETHYLVQAVAGGMVVTDDANRTTGTMLVLRAGSRRRPAVPRRRPLLDRRLIRALAN